MKNLILGLILGFSISPLYNDSVDIYGHYVGEVSTKTWALFVRPSLGIADPLIGNCTKDISKNGHGWVFVNRDFFACNKVQIIVSDLIFGELTRPIDPEMQKKVCTNCKM